MTIKDQIRHLLRKEPELRFNRGNFMFRYIEEFYGAAVYILKDQFLKFWEDEASIERSLRDVLKEPEFRLDKETDSKRYEKQELFRENYATKK